MSDATHGGGAWRRYPGVPGRIHPHDDLLAPDDPAAEHYARVGRSAMESITRALEAAGAGFGNVESCMDLACGFGRVLRLLAGELDAGRITACDVVPEAVAFCAYEFGARPLLSDPAFAGVDFERYDLVWVGSLVTHLDEAGFQRLATLFPRLLNPGGVLVLTTHGEYALADVSRYERRLGEMQKQIESDVGARGVAFVPYEGRADGLGYTWHSKDYLLEAVNEASGGLLEPVAYEPRGWDDHQDVFAFRARGGEAPPGGRPRTQSPAVPTPPGVNVVGYLEAELGVGEAARQVIEALESRRIPVAPISRHLEDTRNDHPYAHLATPDRGPFPVNLLCENAAFTPEAVAQLGDRFFEDRYTIGLWFWEVSDFPSDWERSFACLDEVWVASEHVAAAVRARSPIPVTKITLPVAPVGAAPLDRPRLGLPEGFSFLFLFDHNSVLERKNPLGLIDAFSRAFPAGAGASLVVKAINGDRHPADGDRLRAAAGDHPDVHLIERFFSPEEKNALISACDCYVSLHRSEGFGLTMAEAMYYGRPVIATGYSGNLEFMSTENSYPVGYELCPIGPGSDPYPAEGTWAAPDEDEAAELMRRVFNDPGEAAERGRRASEYIRRAHLPDAAGLTLERRLRQIQDLRPAAVSRHRE